MTNKTGTANPGRMPRLARSAAGALVALGVASTMLGASAGSTLASSEVAVAGYRAQVGAHVICDYSNATMIVSAEAMTMDTLGALGQTASPYDAGQYITHNILVREVGQTSWTEIYSWAPWNMYRSKNVDGIFTIISPAALGTDVVQGVHGHNYEVLVEINYWTGVENVINVTPTYGVVQDGSINTYYLSPGVCRL